MSPTEPNAEMGNIDVVVMIRPCKMCSLQEMNLPGGEAKNIRDEFLGRVVCFRIQNIGGNK